jgi:rSAM/selenodomain-associated transferase 2
MRFSVIIPVLNERACLPRTLDSVRVGLPGAEIIAVDGGCTDGSTEWLSQQHDVRLIDSIRGKGPQQNAGARTGTGDVLLFLHADCQLPAGASGQLERALLSPAAAGGAFFVRFEERRPLSLHVLSFFMNLRLRVLRRCFGDQALFVRREIFEEIGGFPEWPLFEDYELVRRTKRHGRFAVITSPITISARRFLEKGVWRTVLLVFALQAGYYMGLSPARLKQWFADIRPHLEKAAQ